MLVAETFSLLLSVLNGSTFHSQTRLMAVVCTESQITGAVWGAAAVGVILDHDLIGEMTSSAPGKGRALSICKLYTM